MVRARSRRYPLIGKKQQETQSKIPHIADSFSHQALSTPKCRSRTKSTPVGRPLELEGVRHNKRRQNRYTCNGRGCSLPPENAGLSWVEVGVLEAEVQLGVLGVIGLPSASDSMSALADTSRSPVHVCLSPCPPIVLIFAWVDVTQELDLVKHGGTVCR
jgi:hypothetical protein